VLRLKCGDTGRLATAQQRLETARLPGSRHGCCCAVTARIPCRTVVT
jgi:hypothetical protein